MTINLARLPYKMTVISDIHLNHRRVPTAVICSRLDKYAFNNDIMSTVKRITIAGDLFDAIMEWPAAEVNDVELWMLSKLHACKRYGVKLRILEGTPLHDRRQSAKFLDLNNRHGIGADVRYFDKVEIEVEESTGLTFLYVPDEYRSTHAQTLREVHRVIQESNVGGMVDYAIVHGFFDNQVPASTDAHKCAEFREFVRRGVYVGHDHCAKSDGFFHVQGSFDRLGFGYESAKGFYYTTIPVEYESKADQVTFIENEEATIFTYLDCRGKTVEEVEAMAAQAAKSPPGSFFSFKIQDRLNHHPIYASYQARYPAITWEYYPIVGDKAENSDAPLLKEFSVVPINKNTITELISDRLSHLNTPQHIRELCLTYLSDYIAQET